MLAGFHGEKANKRNLHACKSTESIPSSIAHVETVAKSAHADQNKRMERKNTGNECIATPRSDHVSVKQSTQSTPQHGTELERFDPKVEGEHEEEDGNCLVIVTSGDGSGDVAWSNAHESSGEKAS